MTDDGIDTSFVDHHSSPFTPTSCRSSPPTPLHLVDINIKFIIIESILPSLIKGASMTTNFDNTAPQPVKQHDISTHEVADITLQHNNQGLHSKHPQKGTVKVISLFCDCGRSVMVKPKEAKGMSIICNLCNSPFRWQQLSF